MIQVVGITGYKRSGKGTVANFLAEGCTVGTVYQIGAADKVKLLTARALGLKGSPRELIAMMDEAKLDAPDGGWIIELSKSRKYAGGRRVDVFKDLSGRQLLQNVGTEARNLFGEDFWIDQVLPRPPFFIQDNLAFRYPGASIVAITDLRLENEARRVHALGGVIWEVIRPGAESDGHVSEQELPRHLVDYQIRNDGTLGDLRAAVEDAIQETIY